MLTYILVLVLNGTPVNAPVQATTLAACEEAGASWVASSAKLRGPAKGDFVCFPVKIQ
jgi:hypothetical protein